MQILRFYAPLFLTIIFVGPFILQAAVPPPGMVTVERKDIQVLYSPDVKLKGEPEIVTCIFSPKLKAMLCLTPEEFLVRAQNAVESTD